MIKSLKTHKKTIILLLVITLIGFGSKFYKGPFENWVNNSLGGLFYEIFWCLLVSLFFKKPKPILIAVSVFCATCLLEFLQLSHFAVLEFTRKYFIGRVIIGTSFNWSDFIYYFLGSSIGWGILYVNYPGKTR